MFSSWPASQVCVFLLAVMFGLRSGSAFYGRGPVHAEVRPDGCFYLSRGLEGQAHYRSHPDGAVVSVVSYLVAKSWSIPLL